MVLHWGRVASRQDSVLEVFLVYTMAKMSTWSRGRQFTYLSLVVAVVFVAVGFLLWTYWPVPSCFDGRQNAGEAGVDCGGSCARVCQNQAVPLKILWSRVFEVTAGVYTAVAMVENANLEAGVVVLPYSFRLMDESNLLVTFRQGETYANPGEKFIIVEGGIGTGEGRPARAFLEFGPHAWQRPPAEAPLLEAPSKILTNERPARLTVTVANRSIIDLPKVEVAAILSDPAGNVLGSGTTFVENLRREAERQAYFAWPEPFSERPALIDIYPRVNVFSLD